MQIYTTQQIKAIDALTMRYEPISSIDLMERAAKRIFEWLAAHISPSQRVVVLCGPGNNGGDGLAVARMLHQCFFRVEVYCLEATTHSADFEQNLHRLRQAGIKPQTISSSISLPPLSSNCLVVDALFGSGLSRPLSGLAAQLVEHINAAQVQVISIDMPSGMAGEEHPKHWSTVRSNMCLTLGQPKLSLLMPESAPYVQQWEVLDIGLHPQALAETPTPYHFTTEADVRRLMLPRSRFTHKGSMGHTLIVAGSLGMIGAAVLCTHGALRSGTGLVTAHVPHYGEIPMMQHQPEALLSIDPNVGRFTTLTPTSNRTYSAAAIGPGLGTHPETATALADFLRQASYPLVLDADALNIIAQNPTLWELVPQNTIITPHPKEFERLFGATTSGYAQLQKARAEAQAHNIVIVLKGAYTQVVLPNGDVRINSTGNSGMATGGSGDVLSGLIAGLLAQGYNPESAAIVGTYTHGLAGDLAAKKCGEHGMNSTDIANFVALALKRLYSQTY